MRRTASALLVLTVLLVGTVVAERALQKVDREDPLGKELLYLPSPEMLRLASLGNPGLVADLFYIWSIQYYSKYKPHEQFLYLESVYNLITDLDPLFQDPYRIGALIMQLPSTDEAIHKGAVIRLFDKAIRNMPENHEIAETAAWDMYIRYRDIGESIRYLEKAVKMPGAPHRVKRFLAAWSKDNEHMSFDAAYSYWLEVLDAAETDYDKAVCEKQIYRLVASRDEALLDPVLADWKTSHGECPESWEILVEAGLLAETPVDYFGQVYRILPDSCEAMAIDEVRFD